MSVQHKAINYFRWGGKVTSSLCGRLRTLKDGMNLVSDWKEVTCKFCLSLHRKAE